MAYPKLPDSYNQRIIDLRKQHMTYAEIGTELGISSTTVRKRLGDLVEQGAAPADLRGTRGKITPPKGRLIAKGEKYVIAQPDMCGVAGDPIWKQVQDYDVASRLAAEVKAGGYSGHNEFLLELFLDFMAEQDSKKSNTPTKE